MAFDFVKGKLEICRMVLKELLPLSQPSAKVEDVPEAEEIFEFR